MILECAISARAAFIVTGDRHLLDLAHYEGIVMMTPADYLNTIGPTTNPPKKPPAARRRTRRKSGAA